MLPGARLTESTDVLTDLPFGVFPMNRNVDELLDCVLQHAEGPVTGAVEKSPIPTVLSAAAAGLGAFIKNHGGDVDTIFGRCSVAPEISLQPTLQLPLETFCGLFEEAAQSTGQDNFGLLFGSQFQPRDLGMWGYAALSAPTIGAALETLSGLLPYQQSATTIRLMRDQSSSLARLEYMVHRQGIRGRRQDAELSLGQYVNLMRECLGRNWGPEEVWFEHPRPADWRQHETLFGAPVYFGCETNGLVFSSSVLSRPMPGSDPRLHMMMRSCLELLGPGTSGVSEFDRIQECIRLQMAERSPSMESVTAALGMPASTVRRVLAREGLGFREAVDVVRFDLARQYLGQSHLSLGEIAFLLGYSELSAFTRAFTRWAGVSPLRFRAGPGRH